MSRRVVMVAHGAMTSDIRAKRSPLIGAEPRGFPPLKLVSGTSWLEELGRGFHRK